jgi:hypothetical protein
MQLHVRNVHKTRGLSPSELSRHSLDHISMPVAVRKDIPGGTHSQEQR